MQTAGAKRIPRPTEAEVPAEQIRDSRIFHFGTLSMTHEGVRAATRKAVGLYLSAQTSVIRPAPLLSHGEQDERDLILPAEEVTEAGIHAGSLYMDEEVHTTLALVHTGPGGDRDFSFYRNPGADMMLTEAEKKEIPSAACSVYIVAVRTCSPSLTNTSTLKRGDRDFSFYRNPGADMMLTEAEVPAEQIRDSRIFHFLLTCKPLDLIVRYFQHIAVRKTILDLLARILKRLPERRS